MDRWEAKLASREEVSSVFDFSNVGRRITDRPPDMIFLPSVVSMVRGDYGNAAAYEVDSMSFMLRAEGWLFLS